MSYKTYKEYKDSGVKWIGEIPIEWDIIKAKFCFNISHGHYFKSNDFVDEGIDLVRIGDIVDGTIELDNCVKLPFEYSSLFKEYLINPNDLLIALTGGTIGKIGLAPNTSKLMLMNYRVGKINCDNPNYYRYVLSSHFIQTQIKFISEGSAQENIGNKEFDEFIILDIDENTKNAIALYLDKKTKEIDKIISKNKELIKLLEEKRISLINQIVSKGLNPNVPMKESGIDWIGEIPQHWNVNRGKTLLNQLKRNVKPDDDIITCFRDGEVTLRSNRREKGFTMSDKEIGYQGIEENDLVVHGMDGFAGAIGISDSRGKGSPVLIVLDSKQNKKYIMYYLRDLAYNNVFLALSTGIRVRSCDLRWEKLANLMYIIPPLNEQKEIVEYLDNEISKIFNAIDKINKHINLLEEYKTSLIHHTITGKIDVRYEVGAVDEL